MTLGAGTAGGAAFAYLNVPLPWLLGPLLTVGALGLFGAKLSTPPGSRQVGQILLGAGIGLHFSPEVARFVGENLHIMVACALASIGFGTVAGLALRRASGADAATSHFSCVPGGVAEMAVLAERHGGDPGPVALAQSLRILFVVVTIPPALTILGIRGQDLFQSSDIPFDPLGLGIIILGAVAAGGLLTWRKVTNAWILGPLAVGALIAANQVDLSSMPRPILNCSQVLIGSTLGLRYQRDVIAPLKKFLPSAILGTSVLIGLNVICGLAVASLTGLPEGAMVLSMAPGGMAEMAITAQVLALGAPLVTAFHTVRIFLVIGLSGIVYRQVTRFSD